MIYLMLQIALLLLSTYKLIEIWQYTFWVWRNLRHKNHALRIVDIQHGAPKPFLKAIAVNFYKKAQCKTVYALIARLSELLSRHFYRQPYLVIIVASFLWVFDSVPYSVYFVPYTIGLIILLVISEIVNLILSRFNAGYADNYRPDIVNPFDASLLSEKDQFLAAFIVSTAALLASFIYSFGAIYYTLFSLYRCDAFVGISTEYPIVGVQFLYFSLITTFTGFANIYPVNMLAQGIVALQVMLSVMILIFLFFVASTNITGPGENLKTKEPKA